MDKVRSRTKIKRKVDTGDKSIVSKMQDLIRTVYTANKAYLAEKRVHDKARKELYESMLDQGIESFEMESDDDNIHLIASLESSRRDSVDVYKLKELVSEEQFMQIISATQTSVTKVVGSAILNQCVIAGKTSQNVKVKVAK